MGTIADVDGTVAEVASGVLLDEDELAANVLRGPPLGDNAVVAELSGETFDAASHAFHRFNDNMLKVVS